MCCVSSFFFFFLAEQKFSQGYIIYITAALNTDRNLYNVQVLYPNADIVAKCIKNQQGKFDNIYRKSIHLHIPCRESSLAGNGVGTVSLF